MRGAGRSAAHARPPVGPSADPTLPYPSAMVTLEPMAAEAWHGYRLATIRAYADDKVRVGAWPADEALGRSEADIDGLLPEGLATSGHDVRSVVADGEVVGVIWFGRIEGSPSVCFVYDFEIAEAHRGRGYGRAALAALEPIATALGYDAIALHVFGDNEVARNLYQSSGYLETDVMMRKPLR